MTFVNLCSLTWSKDSVLFRNHHEDFGGSSSCKYRSQLSCMFNVVTYFRHLCLLHACFLVCWCLKTHFLPNSLQDGVVQLLAFPSLFTQRFRGRSGHSLLNGKRNCLLSNLVLSLSSCQRSHIPLLTLQSEAL